MELSAQTPDASITISCTTCVARDTSACTDCMVMAVCNMPESGAIIMTIEELREVKLLAKAGLVPTLRHRAAG